MILDPKDSQVAPIGLPQPPSCHPRLRPFYGRKTMRRRPVDNVENPHVWGGRESNREVLNGNFPETRGSYCEAKRSSEWCGYLLF